MDVLYSIVASKLQMDNPIAGFLMLHGSIARETTAPAAQTALLSLRRIG
jgi:hypothetical protein